MLKRRYLTYLPLVIAAAGIATFVGTRSFADSHAMGPDGGRGHWGRWMFQEMDANHDGKGTQAEIEGFEAAQTWRLARMDRNGDGTIDEQDMRGRDGGGMHHRHHPWSDDGSDE